MSYNFNELEGYIDLYDIISKKIKSENCNRKLVELFNEIDKKRVDIKKYKSEYCKFSSLTSEQLNKNIEYKELERLVRENKKEWKSIISNGYAIKRTAIKYNLKLEDDDISYWNRKMKNINHEQYEKMLIQYDGKCKACSREWESESPCKELCIHCERWKIIFELYRIVYENDMEFIKKINDIEKQIYNNGTKINCPKFRRMLEEKSIIINSKIQETWEVANNEICSRNLEAIENWESYSTTEKVFNEGKKIFRKLFK